MSAFDDEYLCCFSASGEEHFYFMRRDGISLVKQSEICRAANRTAQAAPTASKMIRTVENRKGGNSDGKG